MENSGTRNKVSHIHEVVTQLAHWWDDEVFTQFPTWEACERSAIFSRPLLEQYFGSVSNENRDGIASYSHCAKYGIGREVLAKMLEGTESSSAIEEALCNLPMTERRRRYEAAQG